MLHYCKPAQYLCSLESSAPLQGLLHNQMVEAAVAGCQLRGSHNASRQVWERFWLPPTLIRLVLCAHATILVLFPVLEQPSGSGRWQASVRTKIWLFPANIGKPSWPVNLKLCVKADLEGTEGEMAWGDSPYCGYAPCAAACTRKS